MPRIATSLLRKAYTISPLLPQLLQPCRNLRAAQNELRWLREHVDNVAKARSAKGKNLSKRAFLHDLVKQRATGKPLQYLLGTEFFGDLEISCRPGVLIPRQDTATAVQHLIRLLRDAQTLPSQLRVLDLCTGTGCIPLLFHHELYAARTDIDLRAVGVDISDKALQLAVHNLKRVRKDKSWVEKGAIGYMKADVLANPFADRTSRSPAVTTALRHARLPHLWDVLISNPPYISPEGYWKTTTRSVRGFEPKLALVPPSRKGSSATEQGDMFYRPILQISRELEAKVVLLEVADLDQAIRVASAARGMRIFDGIEIWREQPESPQDADPVDGEFRVVGQGNARSVVCWRGAGTKWLGKSSQELASHSIFPTLPSSAIADNHDSTDIARKDHLRPQFLAQIESWKEFERVRRARTEESLPAERPRARASAPRRVHAGKMPPESALPLEILLRDRVLGKHLTHPQQEALVRCYQRGWNVQKISNQFKVHPLTVYRTVSRFRRAGTAKDSNTSLQSLPESQRGHIYQLAMDGLPMKVIAAECNCSVETVREAVAHIRRVGGSVASPHRRRERNERIYQLSKVGWTHGAIAEELSMTRGRVGEIIRSFKSKELVLQKVKGPVGPSNG
ncbi:S-adenosyl-L-methionine-dependent methyltransferase [Bimuria novae-zelandiae CBS 107.79]|uniref:S-adenosyl-L-methionine-dependent methyltransferase n=1 Tax=Bimuria novae-zelandiae CBS 107.79 TaxID=1447943 RepID=A0A6A5UTS9_9PLEO|nr:S-adenosyl-L-methionine-dependent methyltransferase [Bimuria novae-zelandiae CBS 107.79]